ncbi:hypothetical protein L596_009039 [Steinernema carpocapsae]|uniref:Uncharacterized protein n=1 Tax=Steinernema carpocapsae TaxID=34508 RepID=A0A4U5PE81_STECR|nr:hypothetical protein L596_009039 [Steinernema carpocapsae]
MSSGYKPMIHYKLRNCLDHESLEIEKRENSCADLKEKIHLRVPTADVKTKISLREVCRDEEALGGDEPCENREVERNERRGTHHPHDDDLQREVPREELGPRQEEELQGGNRRPFRGLCVQEVQGHRTQAFPLKKYKTANGILASELMPCDNVDLLAMVISDGRFVKRILKHKLHEEIKRKRAAMDEERSCKRKRLC